MNDQESRVVVSEMASGSKAEQPASFEPKSYSRSLSALLASGRYEEMASCLRRAQATDDLVLASILSVAHHLCLVCNEHRRASAQADKREEELRQQLFSVLALAARYENAATGERFLSAAPAESHSLWQRVRRLLEREPGLQAAGETGEKGEGEPEKRSLLDAKNSVEEPLEPAAKKEDSDAPAQGGRRPTFRRIQPNRRLSEERWHHPADAAPEAPLAPATQMVEAPELTVPPLTKAEPGGPSLAIYGLGPFAVYQNDQLIGEWTSLKGLTILKYMVAQWGKPIAKEVLMDVVWPETDPEAARRNLHQAIYSLRQTLRCDEPEFQHIQLHNHSYRFNPQMHLWVDFIEFERQVTAGKQLEAVGKQEEALRCYAVAEELYHGDFFEEDLYEEWTVGRRQRLRTLYLENVDRLTSHYLQRGEYAAVTALCQKALVQDPHFETAHQRLMECYVAQGQRHLAVRQYQTCARLLEKELDLEPSQESRELYERIKEEVY